MSAVYLGRCDKYEEVLSALSPIWRELRAADLVARKRVLLKVNVTKGGPPEQAVCTHPSFAAALVTLVRDSGGQPYVGDSCSIQGFTRETMELAGYARMASELNVPCVPLDSGKIRSVSINGVRIGQTYMSEHILDADVVISAAKLKTHNLVEFSCAVKNMYGVLPGGVKPHHHFRKPRFDVFLDVVLDVFGFVKPALAFVDGILAMEGQGPTGGDPKHVGVVAGSKDPVALDAVLADVVSLPPVKLLSMAGERGLGVSDLDKIEVFGPPVDELRVPLEPAAPSKAKIGVLGKIMYGVRYYGARPVLNTDRKDVLQKLAELCPVDAIKLDGKPRIRRNCVRCMSCVESCEDNAVTVKVPRILHETFRRKAPGYDLSKMK